MNATVVAVAVAAALEKDIVRRRCGYDYALEARFDSGCGVIYFLG